MSEPVDLRLAADGQAPDYATRADWLASGSRFVHTHSLASWCFADWLNAGRERFGADAMREAAQATGASPGKISHYLCVAKAYPPLRRRNGLSFSHHLEVARLPQAEADSLLDRAEIEGWPRADVREAAREAAEQGRVARLLRENAALKRELRNARTDPRDSADHARARFDGERRVIRDSLRRLEGAANALVANGALDGLHGNARRGLARDIRRLANRLADDLNSTIDGLAEAAILIEDNP